MCVCFGDNVQTNVVKLQYIAFIAP